MSEVTESETTAKMLFWQLQKEPALRLRSVGRRANAENEDVERQ